MADNQENKYTMYESTLAVMTANNAIWNAIVPIGDTTGITQNKHIVAETL